MPNWCSNQIRIKTDTPENFDKLIQGVTGDSKQPFDFNRVIPIPEELLEVESPNKSNPDEMTKKYGFPSWYEWRTANWGTKWNACEVDLEIESPTCLQVSFNTAWSPPSNVIEKIASRFPFADIEHRYEGEEGYWGFVEYSEGEIVGEEEGKIDCSYRIRVWGYCDDECEDCGDCDCEICFCMNRTVQTICQSCNTNTHYKLKEEINE